MIRFVSFSGSLRGVAVTEAEQFNVVPGKKLCPQCCNSLYRNKEENYESVDCSSDSIYQNDEAVEDQPITGLTSLGCSPIKFVASTEQLS